MAVLAGMRGWLGGAGFNESQKSQVSFIILGLTKELHNYDRKN
jgi:hypothetical protein